MFTRHDELRESEKALLCMAEYVRSMFKKNVRIFEWRINRMETRFLKSERIKSHWIFYYSILLLISNYFSFPFSFTRNIIAIARILKKEDAKYNTKKKQIPIPKISRDNPPLSLSSSIVAIVEIAMPSREACREISPREEYDRHDRVARVIAPLSFSSEQPRSTKDT